MGGDSVFALRTADRLNEDTPVWIDSRGARFTHAALLGSSRSPRFIVGGLRLRATFAQTLAATTQAEGSKALTNRTEERVGVRGLQELFAGVIEVAGYSSGLTIRALPR